MLVDFKYTTRADALYKQYLVGFLKALNTSVEPRLQDWKHKERDIITSNVKLCLQIIEDFEKREPDFQNTVIKSTELLGKIIQLATYVDTADLLRSSEQPAASEETRTSTPSEVNQMTDAIVDKLRIFKDEYKSFKILLNKECKKSRTEIKNPKSKKRTEQEPRDTLTLKP